MKIYKPISLILVLVFSLVPATKESAGRPVNGLSLTETGDNTALRQRGIIANSQILIVKSRAKPSKVLVGEGRRGDEVIHNCRAPLKVPYYVDNCLTDFLRPVAKDERVNTPAPVLLIPPDIEIEVPDYRSRIPAEYREVPIFTGYPTLMGRGGKRFKIISNIKYGYYGDVYLAKYMGSMVILKAALPYRDELIRTELAFFRDIGEHDNMPKFIDFGRDNEYTWFAMELIEGRELGHWWMLGGWENKDPLAVLDIFKQLLDFLSFIHGKGYLHRDIKFSHVFVTRQNKIKVIDFGVSDRENEQHPNRGQVRGTPLYMSPEATNGVQHTTAKSDIYSVAAMLYELVTDIPLRCGRTATDITLYAATQEAPDPVGIRETEKFKAVWKDFPGIADIIAKALARDPANRYESAAAMKAAIDNLIEESQKPKPVSAGAGQVGSQAEAEAQLLSCV